MVIYGQSESFTQRNWTLKCKLKTMGEGMGFNEIKALEALLTPLGSTQEDNSLQPKKASVTPSSIGDTNSKKKVPASSEEGSACIFRAHTEYDIIYKQDVSPNDVYLQMSDKDPSSLSCDIMILRVKLPQTESVSDIQLDVKATHVKLSTNIYFLPLYLPHRIKHERSTAKWDAGMETLLITMPIDREPFI
ncbi:hypothetical protein KP509_33G026900 [Ceratopteris richardii]|uniref:PIH1D1/2/3 CS-like domain-containing protein n=1 Tax=Ceratopteris richardii TaxID=49495 RepID=A0A8T2QPZ6_CERRI|nr:hypothetical protein KP509_33G026900 [Ceratopteris richardii]